jgi:hypothetical protein
LPHQPGIGQRRQLDQPYAITKRVQFVGRHLQREARLAGATCAGQRE